MPEMEETELVNFKQRVHNISWPDSVHKLLCGNTRFCIRDLLINQTVKWDVAPPSSMHAEDLNGHECGLVFQMVNNLDFLRFQSGKDKT